MNTRSIRWRLVAAMMLVALASVAAVGVLAQALVGRQIARRERQVLTANATAVARQAEALFESADRAAALRDLARTTAFLTRARVVIAGADRVPLADSGPHSPVDEVLWIGAAGVGTLPDRPLTEPGIALRLAPWPPSRSDVAAAEERSATDRRVVIIRSVGGTWGSQLQFDSLDQRALPRSFHTALLPTPAVAVSGRLPVTAELRLTLVVPPGVTVPIGAPESPTGFVTLVQGLDFGASALSATGRALALATPAALLLAGLVGVIVSRGLCAPLVDLTRAAERMGGGDLASRAPVAGAYEIRQLGTAFNGMADRLEGTFGELAAERDALRRFVSDASHQLRTPIAALANFVELLRGPAGDHRAAREEFLAESSTQVERLGWLTANLLDLSRLEMGLVALDLAAHDVGRLLEAAAAAHRVGHPDADRRLVVAAPDPPVAQVCDRARLELAVSNLVDNALKYAPPGTPVTLGADRDASAGEVRMWVEDLGTGIGPDEIGRVFDRFYRGRAAARCAEPGSGLGLAIVRAVAEAHGGRAFVEPAPTTGTRVGIALPIRPPDDAGGPAGP